MDYSFFSTFFLYQTHRAKLKVEYNRLFHLAESGGADSKSSTTTNRSENNNEMKMNRETIRDLGESSFFFYFLFISQ